MINSVKPQDFILYSCLFIFLQSCSLSNKHQLNKEESRHLALYGKWKPIESAPIKSKYIIEFDEQSYTFHVNGNLPYKKSYHIYKDKIIGSHIEGIEIRDSIRFELISPDTLTLEIKEMGKPINVKHFKVSK